VRPRLKGAGKEHQNVWRSLCSRVGSSPTQTMPPSPPPSLAWGGGAVWSGLTPSHSLYVQTSLYTQHCHVYIYMLRVPISYRQRWAKGPIDRSSDTDSIFRFYRTIQSVDVKFRFLYRPIVSVRFKFRFFNRPILFLDLKFRLLYLAIVSASFK
jgi:hypothetical protein